MWSGSSDLAVRESVVFYNFHMDNYHPHNNTRLTHIL